ncbi:MAG: SpoIIAA family protein [Planctomycetota bacterium]|jgi:hypothetical protein
MSTVTESTGIELNDLGSGDPSVIGMKVRGKVTVEGMAEFIARIEEVSAGGKKARVFVDMVGYDGSEFGVAKEKLSKMGTLWSGIERVAYVVDSGWLSGWIGLFDAVTPMHLRAFGPDEMEEAKDWLLSE